MFFFFLVPETTVEGETVRYPSPETAGQLYVHHVSESQAILLTRGLKGDRSTAVGIGAEGAGMYQCVASNAEEINTKTVNINVVIGQYIHILYIMFILIQCNMQTTAKLSLIFMCSPALFPYNMCISPCAMLYSRQMALNDVKLCTYV